jgi:tetratricopeptide (TPR) repeat protein
MKIAHLDESAAEPETLRELLDKGKSLELEKNYDAAVKIYTGILRKKPLNESAYSRLMIVYRKMKDYLKEASIIETAIKAFEDTGHDSKKGGASKIEKLSMSLGKLTGLIDKKGKSLYDPEPIATWRRRAIQVDKLLKKKKKKK